MTLLYMYFENEKHKTYKGIKSNPNGYTFDNRFIVKYDKKTKVFSILDNPDYVQIYNNAISNISCIVGKNGSGKTTFMELLLSNIVWGMTKYQPERMISIYYNIEKKGNIKFFLHLFKEDARKHDYKLFFNEDKKDFEVNHHRSYKHINKSNFYTSTIPQTTKFIFHSLSPFDKIFYSIGKTLKDNEFATSHYIKQMNYIGTQSFFKDEVTHEVQTISNLIRLFTGSFGKKAFKEALGYEFSKLSISFDNINEVSISDIDNYIENIENALQGYQNIKKYPLLLNFSKLSKEDKKKFFEKLLHTKLDFIENGKDLLHYILVDNIDFQRLIYVTNLNKFLNLIDYSINILEKNKLKQKLLNIDIKNKKISFIKDLKLLNELFNNLDILDSIIKLSSIELNDIGKLEEIKDLPKVIKLIKKLQQKGYLEFKLELKKDSKIVSYFFLSSGEKTMMSYFANLLSSINEFKNKKDNTFIIFIDEVELHLHPEWQRSFIDYMNKFFRKNKFNLKFQFIIATHSPFVLSDIVEEQIIFINDNRDNKEGTNTFGANIYDIFEKGFFLENSIGKCSENYIYELSNILYLFKALQHATEYQDYFLIRNYLQKYYEIDTNSDKSIDKQKKELDKKLFRNILNELQNKNLILLENKLSITSIEKYIKYTTSSIKIYEQLNKYINIIGEPTIKNHLKEIYEDIKEFEINAN